MLTTIIIKLSEKEGGAIESARKKTERDVDGLIYEYSHQAEGEIKDNKATTMKRKAEENIKEEKRGERKEIGGQTIMGVDSIGQRSDKVGYRTFIMDELDSFKRIVYLPPVKAKERKGMCNQVQAKKKPLDAKQLLAKFRLQEMKDAEQDFHVLRHVLSSTMNKIDLGCYFAEEGKHSDPLAAFVSMSSDMKREAYLKAQAHSRRVKDAAKLMSQSLSQLPVQSPPQSQEESDSEMESKPLPTSKLSLSSSAKPQSKPSPNLKEEWKSKLRRMQDISNATTGETTTADASRISMPGSTAAERVAKWRRRSSIKDYYWPSQLYATYVAKQEAKHVGNPNYERFYDKILRIYYASKEDKPEPFYSVKLRNGLVPINYQKRDAELHNLLCSRQTPKVPKTVKLKFMRNTHKKFLVQNTQTTNAIRANAKRF